MNRLTEIEQRYLLSTAGPWRFDGRDVLAKDPGTSVERPIAQVFERADGEFLARAKEDIGYLLEQLS